MTMEPGSMLALATTIAADGRRPYRPSNGTEGQAFIEQWCGRCEKDAAYRASGDGADSCPIVRNALLFDIGEPGYPPEWVQSADYDPWITKCTAFEPEAS